MNYMIRIPLPSKIKCNPPGENICSSLVIDGIQFVKVCIVMRMGLDLNHSSEI
jgi:hypothetical protein